MYKCDVLNAVSYYREAIGKSFDLANRYTGQASVQDLSDMRFFYSTCLASIVSLTEYLADTKHPYSLEFNQALKVGFVFDGASDGEENYLYLKGIRNMVVHRGYDLSSQGHVVGNRLWFVLPDEAQSISGKTSYKAYERYLPLLISKTLLKLDSIIHNHVVINLSELNDRSQEEIEAEVRLNLSKDNFLIPPQIKTMILDYLNQNGVPALLGQISSSTAK